MGVRFRRPNRFDTVQNNMALKSFNHILNLKDYFWGIDFRPTNQLLDWLAENIGPTDGSEIVVDQNSYYIEGEGWRYESEMFMINNMVAEPSYDPALFKRTTIGDCVIFHRCQVFFEHESDAVLTGLMMNDIK
jgi:hypothetical protein